MSATSLIGTKWLMTELSCLVWSKRISYVFHIPETFYLFHSLFNITKNILTEWLDLKFNISLFIFVSELKKILKKKSLLPNIF